MSYHNETHRGASHAKGGLGNTKGGTKTGGSTKKGQSTTTRGTQSGQGSKAGHGTHGGQAGHGKIGGGQLQAQDIKSLVRNQGRAILGGQPISLKNPSWNDSALQAIISDPKFTVKPAGKQATDGKWTYELHGHGKTINVTIGH
jgi:hypothetical protein